MSLTLDGQTKSIVIGLLPRVFVSPCELLVVECLGMGAYEQVGGTVN